MANALKHKTQSSEIDLGVAGEIGPDEWNEEHLYAGGAYDGDPLVWSSGETDKADWASGLGYLTLPVGTQGAPAARFTGDPDSGPYLVGANFLGWSTNALGRFGIQDNHVRLANGVDLTFSNDTLDATNDASSDAKIARDAVDSLAFGAATTGYRSSLRFAVEAHTLALAGTSDTAAIIPANALVLGVSLRVTTEITGCTTLDVGVAGATTRYGTGIALVAGTTNASAGTTNPTVYGAATAIRFTAVGWGASFTAGVIRVVVHYISLTPPTS